MRTLDLSHNRRSDPQNVHMANFVPLDVEHLEAKACEAAQVINNDPKLPASFFHHAKLDL